MSHALSESQIKQQLALGKLTTHHSKQIQRHILGCPDCLRRLIEVALIQEERDEGPKPFCVRTTRKPLHFVHDTADGFVYSKVEKRGRKWIGRHWSDELDGVRECCTIREANDYVVASFNAMFPEHRCTERCKLFPPESDAGRNRRS